MLPTRVIIPRRFCGPPTTGNGGYTCALVSEALGSPAEVTLRKPIPIDRELDITARDGQPGAVLRDGDIVIAEGERFSLPDVTVDPISFEEAERATTHSPAFHNHPFPTCFVCGPERRPGDGMQIFPGRLSVGRSGEPGRHDFFAAPWIPQPDLADAHGIVYPRFIWAALDCPTGFAVGFPSAGTLVTGRLGVVTSAPVRAGEKCVLLSWPLNIDGKKHHAAAVLLGEDGAVRAQAKATWIKLA